MSSVHCEKICDFCKGNFAQNLQEVWDEEGEYKICDKCKEYEEPCMACNYLNGGSLCWMCRLDHL